MLFRHLISTYGASLAGKTAPHDDPVWHLGQSGDLVNFRLYALDALQQAKVYLLDHAAAAYADTLHDTIQEEVEDKNEAALTFLGEVDLPADVTWVEFDYRELVAARVQRNSPVIVHHENPSGFGQHGYLIDRRNVDVLQVTMFTSGSKGRMLDPLFTLRFDLAKGGRGFAYFDTQIYDYMTNVLAARGMTAEVLNNLFQIRLSDTATDLFIPYALFAMLVSPDLGGIIPSEAVSFTSKEVRTAQKFGKSWILGAQRSHLTIRIGPQAAAHMQERLARLEFERQVREGRNPPARHPVHQHERHYRSGKVVLITAHHRGQAPDTGLPTRVMGPRLDAVDFVFPADE